MPQAPQPSSTPPGFNGRLATQLGLLESELLSKLSDEERAQVRGGQQQVHCVPGLVPASCEVTAMTAALAARCDGPYPHSLPE